MSENVYIIAEAGVNHNGSLDLAYQLVDRAIEAGVDAVKFQTFRAEALVSRVAPKAEYQIENTGSSESQLEMIRKLEMRIEDQKKLIAYCQSRNIQFLSSPFDLESIDVVAGVYDLPRIKVPSGEITNGPYLLHVARTQKPLIVSTGMSTLGDIEAALGVLAYGYLSRAERPSTEAFQKAFCSAEGRRALREKVTLLHCTTEYPAPFREVNLRAMQTLETAFGLPVGISDHTPGISVPLAAVALGARVVEKHFTLDKSLPGPDHKASLDPQELNALVRSIREIEQALGSPFKGPSPSEVKNIPIARKSLVAVHDLKKGDLLTEANVTTKRPGSGVSPMSFWDSLGTAATKDYRADDLLEL